MNGILKTKQTAAAVATTIALASISTVASASSALPTASGEPASARQIEQDFREQAAKLGKALSVKVKVSYHRRSPFSATAQTQWTAQKGSSLAKITEKNALVLNHQIALGLTSLMPYKARIHTEPDGLIKNIPDEVAKALFKGKSPVSIDSDFGWNGNQRHHLLVQKFDFADADSSVSFKGIDGVLSVNRGGQYGKLILTAPGFSFAVDNVAKIFKGSTSFYASWDKAANDVRASFTTSDSLITSGNGNKMEGGPISVSLVTDLEARHLILKGTLSGFSASTGKDFILKYGPSSFNADINRAGEHYYYTGHAEGKLSEFLFHFNEKKSRQDKPIDMRLNNLKLSGQVNEKNGMLNGLLVYSYDKFTLQEKPLPKVAIQDASVALGVENIDAAAIDELIGLTKEPLNKCSTKICIMKNQQITVPQSGKSGLVQTFPKEAFLEGWLEGWLWSRGVKDDYESQKFKKAVKQLPAKLAARKPAVTLKAGARWHNNTGKLDARLAYVGKGDTNVKPEPTDFAGRVNFNLPREWVYQVNKLLNQGKKTKAELDPDFYELAKKGLILINSKEIKSTLDFTDGVLKANGKTIDMDNLKEEEF